MTSHSGDRTLEAAECLRDLPCIVYRSSAASPRRLGFVSKSFGALFGWPDDTPLETLDQAIHPDDLERVRNAFASALAGDRRCAVDYRLVHSCAPRECWVRDTAVVVRGPDGATDHVEGLLVPIDPPSDLHERSLLRAVIDAIPDSICFKDTAGIYQDCNQAFARDTGLPRSAIVGRSEAELFPNRPPQAAALRAGAVLASGQMQRTEQVVSHSDGQVTHMELVESRCTAPDGRVLGLIGVARDVTERALTEALLHMVASDHPLADVLGALMRFVESQAPGTTGAVLLLDPPRNRLDLAAGPSLPPSLAAASRDIVVGRSDGTCGAACHSGKPVYSADIATDPLWNGLREEHLRHGYRACWATPIFGAEGNVLGTVAIYARAPGLPDDRHMRLADTAARIAAIAIERRDARLALKETSNRLAALVDSAMDAIVTVDRDQRVVLFNSAAEGMFGLPAEEAIGQPLARFIPERYRARHDAAFGRFVSSAEARRQTALRGDVHGLRANGKEFPIEASVSRTRVGGVDLYTAIVRDVTERWNAERDLREALSRFEAVIENTPLVAIQGLARDGTVRHWNRASAVLYGIPAEQAVGRHFSASIDCGAAAESISQEIESVWATGRASGPDEWRTRRIPDGREMWLVSTLFPVFEHDAVSEVFCMDVDITTRKLAEADAQQLNDELESRVRQRTAELQAALDELESFSYSVSHDLRAPLRGIDGYAQVLAEDYGHLFDDKAHSHLARVRGAAQRMATLIDDLLMLAQISRSEFRREAVDLSEIAQRWLVHLAALDGDRKVGCTVQPGLIASGDPALLELVLQNLLDNAWKFTGRRDDAKIEFGEREVDGARAFYVADNGAGFDPVYAGRMFEPFQRLHHVSQFPGTGIGLATVLRIVTRHGGRVWAESAPERGATFYFTLG